MRQWTVCARDHLATVHNNHPHPSKPHILLLLLLVNLPPKNVEEDPRNNPQPNVEEDPQNNIQPNYYYYIIIQYLLK